MKEFLPNSQRNVCCPECSSGGWHYIKFYKMKKKEEANKKNE